MNWKLIIGIFLLVLAAACPIIFMVVYHYHMETWGDGYAFGMMVTCIGVTIGIAVFGFWLMEND